VLLSITITSLSFIYLNISVYFNAIPFFRSFVLVSDILDGIVFTLITSTPISDFKRNKK
jgi:hypothetical protein